MKIKLSGLLTRNRQINNDGLGLHLGQSASDKALRQMFRRPAGTAAILTRAPGGSMGVVLGGRSGRIDSDQVRTLLRGGRPIPMGQPGIGRAPGPQPPISQALDIEPAPARPPPPAPGTGALQVALTLPERVGEQIAASLGWPCPVPIAHPAAQFGDELRQASEAIISLAQALQPTKVLEPAAADTLLNALVERLSAGQARTLALSESPEHVCASMRLIAHQARSIQEATAWPATGAGLIGMGPADPIIDPLLEQARAQALTEVMVRAEHCRSADTRPASAEESATPPLPADTLARIQSDVRQITALEREAADATAVLSQALGQAGFGPSFRLNAFRLDAHTVAAIRASATLGGDPAKVSLVLGLCLGIERRIASSESVGRLERDLSVLRDSIRAARDDLDLGSVRAALSSLKLERFHLEQQHTARAQAVEAGGGDPAHDGSLIDLRAGIADLSTRIAAFEARPDLKLDRDYAGQLRAIDRQLETLAGAATGPARSGQTESLMVEADTEASTSRMDGAPGRVDAPRATVLPGGFTAAELAALGLDRESDLPRITEVCEQFALQGLRAPEQVAALLATAGVIGTTLSPALAASSHPGADNERLAQSLGRRLLDQATGMTNADRLERSTLRDALARALPAPTVPDDDALAITAAGASSLAQETTGLKLHADYLEGTERAADLAEGLAALAFRRDAARARVENHNRALRRGTRPLDLERPRGLAISRALIQAQSLFDEAEQSGQVPDRRRLAALAQSLRGFDPLTFSRPRLGGRAPTEAELRGWAQDPALIELADAVVLLREDAGRELDWLERRFKEAAVQMDAMIRGRAALMGAEPSARLTAGIRSAILAELGERAKEGYNLSNFRPAEHFGSISARLQDWGIDTDRFLPEIRHQLAQSFGPTEVALWAREAGIDGASLNARDTQAAGPREVGQEEAGSPNESRGSNHANRLIDALQIGSNIKFFGGNRWQASAGLRIGVVGGAARTQQSKVANLEIERGIEGYRLTLRAGSEGLYGIDASVSVTPANTIVSIGAKLGVEASRSLIEGFRLRFDDSEAGRRALSRFVTKLIDDPGSIRHEDLASAREIASSTRQKDAIKTSAQASAGVKAPTLATGAASVNVQAGVRAQVGAGLTRESVSDVSLKESSFETSREYAIQASVGLQASARGRVGSANAAAEDTKAQAVELNAEIRYKRILKGSFTPQGQLKNTLLLKQTRAGVASRAVVERLGGEALAQKLSGRPALQAAYDNLLQQVVGNDMIRIRYRLKSETAEQVGRLKGRANSMEQALALDEARQIERERLTTAGERRAHPQTNDALSRSIQTQRREIARLYDEIDALLGSDQHFEPDRVSLMRFRDLSNYAATVPLFVYERGHYLDQQSMWNQIHVELK